MAFREVMLTGSISEAARNLFRTQPAISATIAGLEGELECKLFSRRGGRLHPVPEAHYLFEEVEQILARLENTERTMKGLVNLDQGVLRIVAMPGPSVFLLPQMISDFVKDRPEIKVDLVTRSSAQVIQMMSTQFYDIGLADHIESYSQVTSSPLIVHDIMEFECLCAMRFDDPLAKKKIIHARDLDKMPMAVLQSGHTTRIQAKSAFEGAGVTFNVRFEAQYFIPLLTFVQNDLAYSIVDPWSARSYAENCVGGNQLVFRPFAPAVSLKALIITPSQRPLSSLANSFQTFLKQELAKINEEVLSRC